MVWINRKRHYRYLWVTIKLKKPYSWAKNASGDGVYAKHEGAENIFLVDATILNEFQKA